MRVDQLLLTIHVLALAAWIGAALAEQVIAGRMGPSTEGAVVDQFARDAEAVGKGIFGPAALVLSLTGVVLLVRQHVSWGETWIVLGIGALVVACAIGGGFLIPEGRRIAALADKPGHDPAEVRLRAHRRFLVARIDLVILTLAVADMVFRPGA